MISFKQLKMREIGQIAFNLVLWAVLAVMIMLSMPLLASF